MFQMEALTDIGILRLTITSVIQTQYLKFAHNIKNISQVSQKISKVSKSAKSIQLTLNISISVTRHGFTLPLIKATTLSCQLFVAQYQLHRSYRHISHLFVFSLRNGPFDAIKSRFYNNNHQIKKSDRFLPSQRTFCWSQFL